MGNVALSHSQGMTHQAGHQVPIAVVANDEIRGVAVSSGVQLSFHSFGGVCGKPLQVGPNLKPAGKTPFQS